MFMLGDLEIRILKMLEKKPISTFWLYDTLTKEGVHKLALENAVKSLERKRLICVGLQLQLDENGKKMLTILKNPQI